MTKPEWRKNDHTFLDYLFLRYRIFELRHSDFVIFSHSFSVGEGLNWAKPSRSMRMLLILCFSEIVRGLKLKTVCLKAALKIIRVNPNSEKEEK
jgi:hypothetical protein